MDVLMASKEVHDALYGEDGAPKNSGLILPHSRFRKVWEWFIVVFVLYTATEVPWEFAFQPSPLYTIFVALNIAQDFFFMVDIVINFFSASYNEKGVLISSRSDIAKRYLKSQFIVDFFGSIPFAVISLAFQGSQNLQNVKYLSLVKITRMLRLPQIGRAHV